MKLLISSAGALDEQFGGGQTYVRQVAGELRRHGLDVTLLARAPGTGGAGTCQIARRELDGLPVISVAAGSHLLDALQRVLVDVHPEVLHINGLKPELVTVASALGIPHVVTVHHAGVMCPAGALLTAGDQICERAASPDICVSCYCRQRKAGRALGRALGAMPPWAYRPLGRVLGRMKNPTYLGRALTYPLMVEQMIAEQQVALRQAQRWIAPSRAIVAALERNGVKSSRIERLAHGIVPLTRLPLENVGQRPLRFGYIGQMGRHKGVHALLQAFARLPEKLACELHLIGAPQRRGEEAYLQKSLTCCRGRSVIQHGRVSREQMAAAMGWFDVLVMPTICLEVFGLVVAEAMSAGRPVIATRCGGPEDQIRDGVDGILVPPNDVGALAAAMQALAEQPQRIAELAQAIGPIKTIRQHVDELEAVYRRVMAEGLKPTTAGQA